MKAHGYTVFLPPELYLAVVRLQADKQLGRVFPALYAINEGLYHLGYTSKEVYQRYEKRYSEKLIQEEPEVLTKAEIDEQKRIEELEKLFSRVIEQWNLSRANLQEWRAKCVKQAEKWKDKVPNAKLVLALFDAKPVDSESDGAKVSWAEEKTTVVKRRV